MKRRPPALIILLVLTSLVFIGILIYVYVETKRANPQMIEVGRASGLTDESVCPTLLREGLSGEGASACQPTLSHLPRELFVPLT